MGVAVIPDTVVSGFDLPLFQLLATKVGVDFSTKNQVKRQLGADINAGDQLRFNGDVDCKINVDFLLQTSGLNMYTFLFDSNHNTGQSPMKLFVGGNEYNSCFINSFSLTVKPFEPVMGSATFSSYDPSDSALVGTGDTIDNHLATKEVVYGHNCLLSGAGNVVASNIINDFSYTKTYSRTPIYTLGSQQATSQIVDGVEVDMNVQSTGLNQLIDFSGNKLVSDFGVGIQDVSSDGIGLFGNNLELIVNSGAHVVTEGYSVDGGGTLVTKATIKEVIL
jgi:hypothetical protein